MLGLPQPARPEYSFTALLALWLRLPGRSAWTFVEADRTDQSSGKSRADCVLPDMPPGYPPLQDTAITFRQDCEQRFAKAGLLGVAKGEWPARADAVEQNFPLHLLPPLTVSAPPRAVLPSPAPKG